MKIKNKFLASLLTKIGHEVKAELVVDDANGKSLTFPDISEISEIAEGVAISAPDGTYTIADGDIALIVVVMGGLVTSVTTDEPAAEPVAAEPVATEEINAELAETLTAIVDEIVAVKALNASVTAELKSLKASLKHDTSEGKKPAETNQNKSKFKIVD